MDTTMPNDGRYTEDDLQQLYDRFAPSYRWAALVNDILFRANSLRRWVMRQATGRVLDVASGTGENFPHLRGAAELTAVDLSPQMLERAGQRARRLGMDVDLRRMSAQALQFPDASFDTVTTAMSTCTFPEPVAALREMARVLKPGGHILLLEHGRSRVGWIGRLQDRVADRHYRAAGCRWNQDVRGLLRQAGLQVEATRTTTFGVFRAAVTTPS